MHEIALLPPEDKQGYDSIEAVDQLPVRELPLNSLGHGFFLRGTGTDRAHVQMLAEVASFGELPPILVQRLTSDMPPLAGLTQEQLAAIAARTPGGAANIADIYPLAPLQQGIFSHRPPATGGAADACVLRTVLAFDDRDRLDAFTAALQRVVDRHDILRTAFHWRGLPDPVQVVLRQAPVHVHEVELRPEPTPVARRLLAACPATVPTVNAPLMHVYTAPDPGTPVLGCKSEPGGTRWLALLQTHHLIHDHTATEILLDEVRAVLAVRGDGTTVTQARTALDAGLAAAIREQARDLAVSPATLFHVAYARLVGTLAGRDDVVFGTRLFGRVTAGEGADRAPGPFLNTLPVRAGLGGVTALDAVRDMDGQLARLLTHEGAPPPAAQQASGVGAGALLFTALLNCRQADTKLTRIGAASAPLARRGPKGTCRDPFDGIELLLSEERTSYPLVVSIDDTGTGLAIITRAVAPIRPQDVCHWLAMSVAVPADELAVASGRPAGQSDTPDSGKRRETAGGRNDTFLRAADQAPGRPRHRRGQQDRPEPARRQHRDPGSRPVRPVPERVHLLQGQRIRVRDARSLALP